MYLRLIGLQVYIPAVFSLVYPMGVLLFVSPILFALLFM